MDVKEGPAIGGNAAAPPGAPAPGAQALPQRRSTSSNPLPSYVLSGAADPPLAQQARDMALQLVFAVTGIATLAGRLPWSQLRPIFFLPAVANMLCLVLVWFNPRVYHRLHLHLWINPVLLIIVLWGAMHFRLEADLVFPGKAASALDGGGIKASLTFAVILLLLSGIASGMAAFPLYILPPVSLLPLAALWAAIMSAGNAGVCSAELLQHPVAVCHMRTCYRILEPLVAPLEPLLLAAGIGPRHSERHCHCVLAALQLWVVALAIPLVVVRRQVRDYSAWRAEQRRQWLQHRRAQSEAWGFGFKEPSSCSDCSSNEGRSGGHSPDSPNRALLEVYSQLLQHPSLPLNDIGPAAAAIVRAVRPGRPPTLFQGRPAGRHHPADWQYMWALRVLRTLRPTPAKLVGLTMFASALGAWHRTAFP